MQNMHTRYANLGYKFGGIKPVAHLGKYKVKSYYKKGWGEAIYVKKFSKIFSGNDPSIG
jgi:hypothetical protein